MYIIMVTCKRPCYVGMRDMFLCGGLYMKLKQPLFGNLYTTVYGRGGGVLIITNGLDSKGDEYSYSYFYGDIRDKNSANISNMYRTDLYNDYEEYIEDDDQSIIVEIIDKSSSDRVYDILKDLDFMNLKFNEKVFIACNQK